jgi:hypothetical protein
VATNVENLYWRKESFESEGDGEVRGEEGEVEVEECKEEV